MSFGPIFFDQKMQISLAAILSHLLYFISNLYFFQLTTIKEGKNIWIPCILGDNGDSEYCGANCFEY